MTSHAGSLRWTVGLASLLWIACWSAINGGPWYLEVPPADLGDWINVLRTLAPLGVLVLWLLLLSVRKGPPRRPSLAEGLWGSYALLSCVPALQAPESFQQLYWGLAYLAVFAAAELSIGNPERCDQAMAMNRLNWAVATLLLMLMLLFARDVLLIRGDAGLSAYGLIRRADLGEFGPISRSTGMARLAIVPAVVGLVFALAGRGLPRLFWGALSLGALLLIWLMQARQGIVGALFVVGFVVWMIGGRTRALGLMGALLAGFALVLGLLPEHWLGTLWAYATRGEGLKALETMTGRDLIWRIGWIAAEHSPWIGYGPQADRVVLGMNAQNGVLYAALAAGYPGALLYLGGILWGWVLYVRAWRRGYAETREEWLFMIQAGGIMAYLTLRNIPENTAALFSVDLLLHAPILAWLGTLERARGPLWRRRRAGARAVSPLAAAGGIS